MGTKAAKRRKWHNFMAYALKSRGQGIHGAGFSSGQQDETLNHISLPGASGGKNGEWAKPGFNPTVTPFPSEEKGV